MDNTADTSLIHKIKFFDFIDVIFTDHTRYMRLTRKAKIEHIFGTKRFISIGYPLQILELNDSDMDPEVVLDFLHKKILRETAPKWLRTKHGKAGMSGNLELDEFNTKYRAHIMDYRQMYTIQRKTWESYMHTFPNEAMEDIKLWVSHRVPKMGVGLIDRRDKEIRLAQSKRDGK